MEKKMRKSLICSAAFIFTILAFGTLFALTYKDNSTGLFWYGSYASTWQQALSYCESLTAEGYNDWRLPNKNEIVTIMLNRDFFGTIPDGNYYWTSTSQSDTKAYCLEPRVREEDAYSNSSVYYDLATSGCTKAASTINGNGIRAVCVR